MILKDNDMQGMTYPAFTELIKLQGEKLKNDSLTLPDEKYADIVIILYNDRFYVNWMIFATVGNRLHDDYTEVFTDSISALNYYNNLENSLNGERYE